MNPAIEVCNNGRAIRFPYALKDQFRNAFPSAKWNPGQKKWEVGPRTVSRLATWASEMLEAANALKVKDDVDFTEAELAKVRAAIAQLGVRSSETEKASNDLRRLHLALEASRSDFKRASETAAAASAKRAEQEERINEIIFGLLDKYEIDRAIKSMSWNMKPADCARKKLFREAQAVIVEAKELLSSAGWRCKALDFLAEANVNRPDRDHPMYVTKQDWLNLKKISA